MSTPTLVKSPVSHICSHTVYAPWNIKRREGSFSCPPLSSTDQLYTRTQSAMNMHYKLRSILLLSCTKKQLSLTHRQDALGREALHTRGAELYTRIWCHPADKSLTPSDTALHLPADSKNQNHRTFWVGRDHKDHQMSTFASFPRNPTSLGWKEED